MGMVTDHNWNTLTTVHTNHLICWHKTLNRNDFQEKSLRPASPLVSRCEKSLSHWRPHKSQRSALLKGTCTTITHPKKDLIIKFYSPKGATTIPDIFMGPPPLPSLNHWTSLMAPNVCLQGKYFLKHIVFVS